MKTNTIFFLIIVFIALAHSVSAQQIQAYRTFGGMRFEMDTLTLTHRQVSQLLTVDPLASQEFSHARKLNALSGVLGFSGAMLVTIPVVSAILGGDPEWALAAGGAVLLAGSIPLNWAYQRRAAGAIESYNNRVQLKGRLYLRGAGIAVRL